MITRITKNNVDKYRALFADAVLALQTHSADGKPITEGGTPVIQPEYAYKKDEEMTAESFIAGFHYFRNIGSEEDWELTPLDHIFNPVKYEYAYLEDIGEKITSLEEYFGYIKELRAINDKFVMLPLDNDEEYFYIDANTRTIKVPDSFAKNGISVQGDVISEILYFKIDRFYDMDDLAQKDVYIEWRTSELNEEGKQIEGVSVPYTINSEVAPGYVIIGWPISPELTKKAGKIDFSVRFFTIDDEDGNNPVLKYSFSTLQASVNIKPSLNLDLKKITIEDSQLNYNSLIEDRLVNTESSNASTPAPEKPVFIEQQLINCYNHEIESVDEKNGIIKYKVYLTNPNTGEEKDGEFVVQVGKPTDTGRLSYVWTKRDNSELPEIDSKFSDRYPDIFNANAFIEVPEEAYETEEGTKLDRLYYQAGEMPNTFKEIVFTEEQKTLFDYRQLDENFIAYERKAIAVLTSDENKISNKDQLGYYQVRAINRLGRKTAKAFSNIIHIDGPNKPEIEMDLVNDNTPHLIFDDNGEINLQVQATTDINAYTNYVLFKVLEDNTEKIIQTNTNGKFILQGDKTQEDDMGDGNYCVFVRSLLNGEIVETKGEKHRITYPASPVLITNKESSSPLGKFDINEELSITYEIHPSEIGKRTEEDTITYQWYKYKESTLEQLATDIEKAKNGEYQVRPEQDIELVGAIQEKIKLTNTEENENGYYFCCVTNTYNGSSITTCSAFFDVVDTSKENE